MTLQGLLRKWIAPAAIIAFAMPGGARAVPVVSSATGADPAAIQATVDAYRTSLGALNPNVVGSLGSGRREINWDGVPDAASSPNSFPANFFNVNSPRGAVFSTPGTGFQVSANAVNPTSTPVEFGNIDPSYTGLFRTFSPQRLFTSVGSNITDVNFFVPGSTAAALVSGFGAVFTDVDSATSTSLQFFDVNNNLLVTALVPSFSGNESLSFVGVRFTEGAMVSRVRITSGNAALAAGVVETGTTDLVVMDDFIYGEPIAAVPEPSTMVMAVSAGAFGMCYAWRRRKAGAV